MRVLFELSDIELLSEEDANQELSEDEDGYDSEEPVVCDGRK